MDVIQCDKKNTDKAEFIIFGSNAQLKKLDSLSSCWDNW